MRLAWPRRCWLFFFSSRRRHTRCLSDWSSDVCSSDLESIARLGEAAATGDGAAFFEPLERDLPGNPGMLRSEERRVGKECRSRSWTGESQNKRARRLDREEKNRTTKTCGP